MRPAGGSTTIAPPPELLALIFGRNPAATAQLYGFRPGNASQDCQMPDAIPVERQLLNHQNGEKPPPYFFQTRRWRYHCKILQVTAFESAPFGKRPSTAFSSG